MTKRTTVAQRKEAAGYQEKGPSCSSCQHLSFDLKPIPWMVAHNKLLEKSPSGIYSEPFDLTKLSNMRETDMRCEKAGFAVKKMGWCPSWSKKTAEQLTCAPDQGQ